MSDQLPFRLPDFTRVIWHSEQARGVWAGRVKRINHAWSVVEREAVAERQRDACLIFADPSMLPELSLWAGLRKIALLVLNQSGVASQYSATPKPVAAGRAWQYRIALTTRAPDWLDAWERSDNQKIGQLLGYPACCVDFFDHVWVKGKRVDTSWPMAVKSPHTTRPWARGISLGIKADQPPEANILLRWLGVRLVPHLPCSFSCDLTAEHGRDYATLGRCLGFAQEIDWTYEMLSWPVEWSALHGIAEIKTPILTVSTRTDATGLRRAVVRDGVGYPPEGSQGLKFPFRIVKDKATASPSFVRSVTPVWELNGFGSEAAMERAHAVVGQLVGAGPGRLLDLGCGTGRLLEAAQARGWTVHGVESDPVRSGAAQVPVRRGDLLDPATWEGDWDLIIFMPGRLIENVGAARAEAVRAALRARAKRVLVYAYGDWLTRFGDLGPLVAEAGLGDGELLQTITDLGAGAAAALLEFHPVHSHGGSHEHER